MTDMFRSLANLLGSLICHQLPSRSLTADGVQLPVCARDTGIYLGMFISFIFIFTAGRSRSDRPPGITAAIVLCILMLPMMLDGGLSYMGVYETGNTARLVTGVLFGLPIPLFLVPAANFKIRGKNEAAVLKSLSELAVLVAAALPVSLLILEGVVPYFLSAAVFMASFLFFMGRIAYTVVSRTFTIKMHYRLIFSSILAIGLLSVLYLVSSLVLQPAKAVFGG